MYSSCLHGQQDLCWGNTSRDTIEESQESQLTIATAWIFASAQYPCDHCDYSLLDFRRFYVNVEKFRCTDWMKLILLVQFEGWSKSSHLGVCLMVNIAQSFLILHFSINCSWLAFVTLCYPQLMLFYFLVGCCY